MRPEQPLPLSPDFQDADEYVKSLLHFVTTSELLQTLCGGVHVRESVWFQTPEVIALQQLTPASGFLYERTRSLFADPS